MSYVIPFRSYGSKHIFPGTSRIVNNIFLLLLRKWLFSYFAALYSDETTHETFVSFSYSSNSDSFTYTKLFIALVDQSWHRSKIIYYDYRNMASNSICVQVGICILKEPYTCQIESACPSVLNQGQATGRKVKCKSHLPNAESGDNLISLDKLRTPSGGRTLR